MVVLLWAPLRSVISLSLSSSMSMGAVVVDRVRFDDDDIVDDAAEATNKSTCVVVVVSPLPLLSPATTPPFAFRLDIAIRSFML